MPTSKLDYLKALVVCLIVSGLYDQWVAPQLVGQNHQQDVPPRPINNNSNSALAGYFRPDAWQLDNPMQIEMEMGVLLFKKWERKTDTRWKLSPVTLLLRGDSEKNKDLDVRRPILLEAPGGAEIEFSQSLAVIDGDTPPVTSGHLIGSVQLYGPPTKADKSDQLLISASDVRINGKKVWTTAPVRVQFGKAIAEGRDLTITLAGGGNIRSEQANSPLSILNNLSLIYLDRLHIPLEQPSLWPPLEQVQAAHPKALSDPNQMASLEIGCGGALRFDFTTYTLSLNDQVTVQHSVPGLPMDRLQCPTLTIELEDPFGNSVAKPTPDRMIRRIRAFGGEVRFDAPTLLSKATAEFIEADFRAGKIEVKSSSKINVIHQQMQLLLSDLQYRFAPGNFRDMIQLKSNGTGQFIAHDDTMPLRSFQWKEQLRVTPERQANKYQLWMLQALAILPDDGRIKTDDLRFGFYYVPNQSEEDSDADDLSLDGSFRAENIVAKGNVLFDTRQVYAETDELDLFLEQITDESPEEKQLQLTRASGDSMRLWTREPESDGLMNSGDGGPQSRRSRTRPRLRGRNLSAYILTDGKNAAAREFRIDHNVRLEHVLETDAGPTLVVLTGDDVVYVDGSGGQIMQISGTPAQVEIADGYFRGPMVQLRIAENVLYMDRAGEFQMPMSMMPDLQVSRDKRPTFQQPAQDKPPNFRWIVAPKCTWQGQMHFNGKVARLLSNVRLTGALATIDEPARWDVHVGCELLEVTLKDRVVFSDPDAAKQSQVQQLALKSPDEGGVVLLSAVQRSLAGELLGSHQMQVPSIDIYPESGNVLGAGPGWYHMWGKPKLTENSPLAGLTKSGSWQAAHLIYQEAIEGNLHEMTMAFVRGVRVAMGPVPDAQQRIDASRIVEAQLGQAVMDCDRLELSQTPSQHRFNRQGDSFGMWEARAVSNVAFQGRNEKGLVRGRAERLSYAADKDLFVVEGGNNRPAEFYRQYADGAPGGVLKAYSLKFKPRTFEPVNMRFHSLDMGNLDRLKVPGGPRPSQAGNARPPALR